jgi:Fip1 motif
MDKPWTKGDPSDWFNYGFDEESFTSYVNTQIRLLFEKKIQDKSMDKNGEPQLNLIRPP